MFCRVLLVIKLVLAQRTILSRHLDIKSNLMVAKMRKKITILMMKNMAAMMIMMRDLTMRLTQLILINS
jgi:hypothetical protein